MAVSSNYYFELISKDSRFNMLDEYLTRKTEDKLSMSRFAVSDWVLEELMKSHKEGTDIPEWLVKDIRESNNREVDIDTIRNERELKTVSSTAMEKFFKAFDDSEVKERLFILMGETGVGKSYHIEERYPEIPTYACNKSIDPYTLCYYLADKDGKGLRPYETPFLKALKHGGKIFLDEMNELPIDTLMFLQGITDEKKQVVVGDETVTIHSDFKMIAAINPPSETDERTPLGDAILGRAVGYTMELTDKMIADRLGITEKTIIKIRELHTFMKNNQFTDLRNLNYRDFQKFVRYDFQTQFKFKCTVGDVTNIHEYQKVEQLPEFQRLVGEIVRGLK